jgi:hypothetical protein
VGETDALEIPRKPEGLGFSGQSHNVTDMPREGVVTSIEHHKQVGKTSMEK